MRRQHHIIVFCSLLLLGCASKEVAHKTPYSLVPETAECLIQVKNLNTGLAALKEHRFLKELGTDNPLLLPESLTKTLSLFESRGPGLFSLIENKPDLAQAIFVIPTRLLVWPSDSLGLAIRDSVGDQNRPLIILESQGTKSYQAKIDSLTIFGSTPSVIYDLWDQKVLSDLPVEKILSLKHDKDLVVAQRGVHQDWLSFDLQLTPDGMSGHGVLRPALDTLEVAQLTLGQRPQVSRAPEITPLSAKSAQSLVYNQLDTLTKQLKRWSSTDPSRLWTSLPTVYETADELTLIQFDTYQALVLHSLDTELSLSELNPLLNPSGNYRSIDLFDINGATKLLEPFRPLVGDDLKVTHCFIWDSFVVFTPDDAAAKEFIGLLQNNEVVAASSSYEGYQSYLAAESSMLYMNMKGQLDPIIQKGFGFKQPKVIKKFPLIVTQAISDRGFNHINFIAKSNENKSLANNQVQLLTTTVLEEALLARPQFFTNHKTSGKDIVAQDIGNKLYFIGANGKILWTKALGAPILGSIQEVDLLRNGKKQLAFATAKGFYILDRNGQNVSPFPKLFKDPITQPLAIFDYDNNRKYRFVIVQGKEVLMFDRLGKRVKGFTFNKAAHELTHAPTHIRIGTKDYLLIQEANGRLQILNRVGKTRITVNDQFDFGAERPRKEGRHFVFWTKDLTKITIDTNGKVQRDPTAKAQNSLTHMLGPNKVSLDENLLRINGRLIELPLGLYDAPQLFDLRGQLYVALHNRETNSILILNKSGDALKNFPVYGSSSIDMADMNRNKKSNFIVQGQTNEILIYQIQ